MYKYIWKTKLTENNNFNLFAVNGKRKWQIFVSFLQTEIEKRNLFFFVCKWYTVIDDAIQLLK